MFLDRYLNENSLSQSTSGEMLDGNGLLEGLLEAEDTFNEYTMAMFRVEHESIVNEDASILKEAMSDYVDKARQFFDDLWEKIKKYAKWVWAQIQSVFMKKKDWVKRYKDQIKDGAEKMATRKRTMSIPNFPEEYKTLQVSTDKLKVITKTAVDELGKSIGKVDSNKVIIAKNKLTEVQRTIELVKFSDVDFTGTEITALATKCIDFVIGHDPRIARINNDSILATVRKQRDELVKAANKKGIESESISNAKKVFSYTIRTQQLTFATQMKYFNSTFSVCRKLYNFSVVGSSTVKKDKDYKNSTNYKIEDED
jgi:hypothetical protein